MGVQQCTKIPPEASSPPILNCSIYSNLGRLKGSKSWLMGSMGNFFR